jgi:hypothetical protein
MGEKAQIVTFDAHLDDEIGKFLDSLDTLEQESETVGIPDTQPLESGLPPFLKFVMSEGIATFEASLDQPIIIGRNSSSGIVTVDLSNYNAIDLGISRQHVKIETVGDSVIARDLDTVNGTRLNNLQMVAGRAYELQHGDEMKLGRLKMRIFFMYVEINSTSP